MQNVGLRTATQVGDASPFSSEAPAIAALERNGFNDRFTVEGNRFRLSRRRRCFRPEELRIRDYFRFEGTSDPDDMSVIYALEARDGARGYLVDAFGSYADPLVSVLIARIPMERLSGPAPCSRSSSLTVMAAIGLGLVALAAGLGALRVRGASRTRSRNIVSGTNANSRYRDQSDRRKKAA